MPVIFERKLFKIGEGGIAVTLPKSWVRYYQLQPGDKIEMIVNQEIIIRGVEKEPIKEQTNSK